MIERVEHIDVGVQIWASPRARQASCLRVVTRRPECTAATSEGWPTRRLVAVRS
jgi:hypothetical protein